VGPTAGLEEVVERKFSKPYRDKNLLSSSPQTNAIPLSLGGRGIREFHSRTMHVPVFLCVVLTFVGTGLAIGRFVVSQVNSDWEQARGPKP
jgi:hypothetical protein